jgi:hypothetical protein
MAYPTLDGPYGYVPVNLIGGQVFAGSTRMYPINYGYNTSIFFGDPVTLTTGNVTLPTLPVNSTNTIVGFFLGCTYTDPVTKQKRFSQYWPASTLAGDCMAYVADDPDVVIKTAVTAGANSLAIASANSINVGSNLVGNSGALIVGSTATGNSKNGVIAATAAGATTAGFRVLGLVPDTQALYGATYVSGTGTTSLVVSGLPVGTVLPIGTEVFNSIGGGTQYTGSFLTAASTVTTSGNTTLTVTASTATVSGAVAIVVTPEVLVKVNFGVHRYNIA